VHGPPSRNAADGWTALTKLAETLAEVGPLYNCCIRCNAFS
jgi:hypothetical protein